MAWHLLSFVLSSIVLCFNWVCTSPANLLDQYFVNQGSHRLGYLMGPTRSSCHCMLLLPFHNLQTLHLVLKRTMRCFGRIDYINLNYQITKFVFDYYKRSCRHLSQRYQSISSTNPHPSVHLSTKSRKSTRRSTKLGQIQPFLLHKMRIPLFKGVSTTKYVFFVYLIFLSILSSSFFERSR
jgi:hypothetical protein